MGVFSGPNVVEESDYLYHVCTSSGTFIPNFSGSVEYLIVAGGGGGGMDMGGGGGGGGVLSGTTSVAAGTSYTVTVGAGGTGAPAGNVAGNSNFHQFIISATSGGNSVFGSLTATGGGYGGSSYFGYTPNYGYGASGGSGGGASGYSDGSGGRNGSGTGGQGNAGGASLGQYYSGGGGGAGAAGEQNPPHGGAGILNNILGIPYYWAGGGGGAAYSGGVGGNGGIGGGGGGSSGGTGGIGLNNGFNAGTGGGGDWVDSPGGNGGSNTGGGGGGGMHYNRNNTGGNGGSGIVVIRYLKTVGQSTFNGVAAYPLNPLIFSLDAANVGKGFAVDVLVVAGGAGGGIDMGGGGGGGQVVQKSVQVTNGVAYLVTVGAGGAGSPGYYASVPAAGSPGGNSIFNGIFCFGGGGGGSGHYYPYPYAGQQGQDGGNAGGDSPLWGRNRGSGQTSSFGGYTGGGAGYNGDGSYTAGGGAGAAGHGDGGRGSWRGGNGGIGFYSAINGTGYYWGGGGGGAGHTNTAGAGGAGGGGGGSAYSGGTANSGGSGYNSGSSGSAAVSANGGNAGANTGGGGGGGAHYASVGGNGGSGIVIIRYYGSQKATGGSITSSGGYTIHTFTSSGTFTPTDNIGASDMSVLNTTIVPVNVTRGTGNGGSFDFSGTSSYMNLPINMQAGLTSASYEFWCKPTSLPGGGAAQQLYIQESSTWIALYNVGYVFFGIDLNNGSGWFDNNGGSNTGARTTTALSANNTYHVVYSWDGSNVRVYLNGVLEATASTLQASNGRQNVTQLGPGTTSRNIGSRNDGSGSNWIGSIYSVKFYNKALSGPEVFQNFTAMRGRFGI